MSNQNSTGSDVVTLLAAVSRWISTVPNEHIKNRSCSHMEGLSGADLAELCRKMIEKIKKANHTGTPENKISLNGVAEDLGELLVRFNMAFVELSKDPFNALVEQLYDQSLEDLNNAIADHIKEAELDLQKHIAGFHGTTAD